MQRLRVRMFLPGECGGGVVAGIDASGEPTWANPRRLDVRRRIGGMPISWQRDGFLSAQWLGAVPLEGWSEQEWLCTGHMEGWWRVEAMSWAMHFGRVYVRGVVEGAGGQARVVAEQELILNESPGQAGGLRLIGQDAAGRIRLGVRPVRSLVK